MLDRTKLRIEYIRAVLIDEQLLPKAIRQKLCNEAQLALGEFVHPAREMQHRKPFVFLVGEIQRTCDAPLKRMIGRNALGEQCGKSLNLCQRKCIAHNEIHR